MRKPIPTALFLCSMLTACWFANANTISNDTLKQTCSLFSEAMLLTTNNTTKIQYVNDNLATRVTSTALLDAYSTIFQIDPEDRYELFIKSVAPEGSIWTCPALNQYFKIFVVP